MISFVRKKYNMYSRDEEEKQKNKKKYFFYVPQSQ